MCSRQSHPHSRESWPSVYHCRPYNAISSSLLQVGSICGLGPDLTGIHSISSAARYRVAACSSTLRRGLDKINESRGHNCTSLFALSPAWERDILFPSMTFHTANAFDIVCRLDRDDILDEVPQNKKQKVATNLLLDKMRTQDFAGPLSGRATRVLGPINRHRIADILPHMNRVSRASPALDYLLASSASSVMGCALHRDFTLRKTIIPAVLDVRMNLTPSLTTMSPRLHNLFRSGGTPLWYHQEIVCYTIWSPGCSCEAFNMASWSWFFLTHSSVLITSTAVTRQTLGTLVTVTGRVRFMTAITLAYAHAYLIICLGMHSPGVPYHAFRLSRFKFRYPCLPNDRSLSKELGHDYHGCGTRVVDGETVAGWGVISRSSWTNLHHVWSCCNYKGPSGFFWFKNTNNTAEMTAMKDCRFLVLEVLSLLMNSHVFLIIPCMLLAFVWARFKSAHMCSWRSRVNSLRFVFSTDYDLPCNTCTVTVGIWATNAPIMLLPLALLGLICSHNVTSGWVRHNFDTSVCFEGHHSIREILERLQHIRSKHCNISPGRSLALTLSHRVLCVQCAPFTCYCHVSRLISALLFLLCLDHCFPSKRWIDFLHPRLLHRALTTTPSIMCRLSTSWTSTWLRSHSLVTLLLTFYVTRRKCSSSHDATLGAIAPEGFYFTVAPLPL